MTPLQTIAVGFDGSPSSEIAVRWAFATASHLEARVVLVHAVGLLEHQSRLDVPEEFTAAVATIAEELDFEDDRISWLVDNGDSCSVLLRCIDEPVSADLLVVGSRGQGVHAGLMLGSTSLQLAERSTIPLVIVPSGRPAS